MNKKLESWIREHEKDMVESLCELVLQGRGIRGTSKGRVAHGLGWPPRASGT